MTATTFPVCPYCTLPLGGEDHDVQTCKTIARAFKTRKRPGNPERHKMWKQAHPELVAKYHTDSQNRRKYGITPEQFASMLAECKGRCLCCKVPFSDILGERPCVDHCHRTGVVRGVICHLCNILLGHAHDNPKILRACAQYLEHAAK